MDEQLQGTEEEKALVVVMLVDARAWREHYQKQERSAHDNDVRDQFAPGWRGTRQAHRQALTFDGDRCPSCGGTLYYCSNEKCVACSKRRSNEWRNGKKAEAATCLGRPCTICGARLRYVKSRACVACAKASDARAAGRAPKDRDMRKEGARARTIVGNIRKMLASAREPLRTTQMRRPASRRVRAAE